MDKNTILIIISSILTTIGVPIVLSISSRKKSAADIDNTKIGGEINLSKGWEDYAAEQKKDRADLRTEFLARIADNTEKFDALQTSFNKLAQDYVELQKDFNAMKEKLAIVEVEKEKLAIENTTLVERVKVLESQVVNLQGQVIKNSTVGEQIINSAHEKLDEIKEEIKQ